MVEALPLHTTLLLLPKIDNKSPETQALTEFVAKRPVLK